ncbi:hypothetical protein [Candidatus Contubernalis alkaliaceticus]|nr:hypothetical protein [Candidatus Contubernalis alkalaceticus]
MEFHSSPELERIINKVEENAYREFNEIIGTVGQWDKSLVPL